MIALLFLTYDNIQHSDVFRPYIDQCNTYIHPKYPQLISPKYRPFIIQNHIETQWGKFSIVQATLNLLQAAFANIDNNWFILLSQDCYPIYSVSTLKKWLNTQTRSIFHSMPSDTIQNKTSQWWVLNRADAEVILRERQLHEFPKNMAVDEIYFLSHLKLAIPNYTFTEQRFMYDTWVKNIVQKSPTSFTTLLSSDWAQMRLENSWFIRKTLPWFTFSVYTPKRELWVIHMGTETHVIKLADFVRSQPHVDIILLLSVPLQQIPIDLQRRALQIIPILWNFFDKTVASLSTNGPFSEQWTTVKWISEQFNIRSITTIGINNEAVYDSHQHKMIVTSKQPITHSMPYKIAFLFITLDDVHYPRLWEQYFAGNESRISIYCHSKYPDRVTIPWLKQRIIQNIVPTEWGRITEALLALLREAMKDPDNQKFVIISESCIPLKKFNRLYGLCTQADIRTSFVKFMKIKQYDLAERIQTQEGYRRYMPFIKHYSRYCLSRYHVQKIFLRSSPEDLMFFNKMLVGDEFILTLLHPAPNKDFFINFEITYDNWERIEIEKKKINQQIQRLYELAETANQLPSMDQIRELTDRKNRISANPYSYNTVTQLDILEALGKESFFWRKFPKPSLSNNLLDLVISIRPIRPSTCS